MDLMINIVEQNNKLISQNQTLSSQNHTISKKLENIEDKITPIKIFKNDFNITTFKQASKLMLTQGIPNTLFKKDVLWTIKLN
ncbi:MAG: hypothetical protein U9N59_02870, partial [Campylobacterota bacterium]|nr:hypothetical protein [Campylobacterota bacterium]